VVALPIVMIVASLGKYRPFLATITVPVLYQLIAEGDTGPVPAPVARIAAAMSDRSSSFSSRVAAGSQPST
jgi:hypothetical protein